MVLLISAALSSLGSRLPYLIRLLKSSLINKIKGKVLYRCKIKDDDDAYHWVMSFIMCHPNNQNPSSFELASRPSYWHKVKKEDGKKEGDNIEDDDDDDEEQEDEAASRYTRSRSSSYYGYLNVSNEKRISRKIYITPNDKESLHFIFDGTHFWAQCHDNEDNRKHSRYISISYASRSPQSLYKLIAHCRNQVQHESHRTIPIFRLSSTGSEWRGPFHTTKRSFASIHLPNQIKEEVLEDAKRFLSKESRQTYRDREIPWRRGYLLYGPPGTGKSTLCQVIASELKLPIYEIKLNNRGLDDAQFIKIMTTIQRRAMVLIEDVDSAFSKRKVGSSNTGSSVSFSALLNGIDGTGASEGRLLFMTTNHRDQLDAALTRCGRVDCQVVFHNATKSQAKEMFLRFHMPKGQSIPDILEQSEEFASLFIPDQVSVSSLQDFLLQHRDDASKAVQGIAEWCKEQAGSAAEKASPPVGA